MERAFILSLDGYYFLWIFTFENWQNLNEDKKVDFSSAVMLY